MRVHWLFEEDPIDIDETERLRAAVRKMGLPFTNIPTAPLYHSLGNLCPDDEDLRVFFYGSLQVARKILREDRWRPGAFLTLDQYRCDHYYPAFEMFLFNSPYQIVPLGEALESTERICEELRCSSLFIRPNTGLKTFTGQVFNLATMDIEFKKLRSFYGLTLDDLVLVSRPKDIKREWRLFIVGEEVVAGSLYRENGYVVIDGNVPDDVYDFARNVLIDSTYRPDPAWVMDVCEDEYNQLWMLEIGSISCCGIYGADEDAIVKSVSELL